MFSRPLYLSLAAVAAVSMLWWPADASAQGRRGRVGSRVVVAAGPYRPYYRTYYRPYFYTTYFWGMPGWGFWGYPPPYAYGPELGSARLQVTPEDTEVYLDGHLVGVVDDFDGFAQRLRVPPGQYDLELYRDGFLPLRQKVLLTSGSTLKIRHAMERAAEGAPIPPRPAAPAPAAPPAAPPTTDPTPARRAAPPRRGSTSATSGAVSVRVQPEGATVTIDGEEWEGADAGQRLVVNVAPGRHAVRVTLDGYDAFTTEVEVPAGETRTLNVSLRRDER